MRARITTRTIAKAAGVDVSTVSRALRGVPGVSQAKRELVCETARRLGYRPNPFVSALTAQVRTYRRSPATATLAVLDCWPRTHPDWANFDSRIDYIGGIRRRADELGYRVEAVHLADMADGVAGLNRMFATRRIHGCLVLPVPADTDLRDLSHAEMTSATIDFSLEKPYTMRRASPNYYHNMQLALRTLVARGYRRIAFLRAAVSAQRQDQLSLAAFLAFRAAHPGRCTAPGLIGPVGYRARLFAWLDKTRPDAVLSNDLDLPGDIEAAGCRVPDDVACVSLTRPPPGNRAIAHVDENCPMVGAQAVDMIVDAIHRNEFGLPSLLVVHMVDGEWREGETVRPPLAPQTA